MVFAPSAPILFLCEWLISVRSLFSLHCCQNHNLTCKCNVVNVLSVVNACPMLFAPSAPILLRLEWLIFSQKCIFLNVAKITISPPNSIQSMCCCLPMLLQSALLLLLQFHCAVSVISVSSVFFL